MTSRSRIVLSVVAAFAGLALLGACSSASPAPAPPVITRVVETTSTTTASVSRSQCNDTAGQLGDLWGQYATTLQDATALGLSSAVASNAIDTGRTLINTSRLWVANCGVYFPAQAASLSSSIDSAETVINGLS